MHNAQYSKTLSAVADYISQLMPCQQELNDVDHSSRRSLKRKTTFTSVTGKTIYAEDAYEKLPAIR